MRKSFKRALSMALVVVMLMLMLPAGIFSTVAAESVDQTEYDKVVNMFIGTDSTPAGAEGDELEWPCYPTFFDAQVANANENGNYNKEENAGFATADKGVLYVFHVVGNVTETKDWGINFREDAIIKKWDKATSKPTITLAVTTLVSDAYGYEWTTKDTNDIDKDGDKNELIPYANLAYSAWLFVAGAATVSIENVDITMDSANMRDQSIVAMGADTTLTLDSVKFTTQTDDTSWTVQMRAETSKSLTFKGACSFVKGTGADSKWLGGWATHTGGGLAKEYTVNFDGATITAPFIINNANNSKAVINVNITNGSKLTSTGAMFCNLGGGKINITATSAAGATGDARTALETKGSSSAGRMFYPSTTDSTVGKGDMSVTLDNVKITGSENVFHARGNGTATDYTELTVNAKNCEIDVKGNQLLRAEGGAKYAHVNAIFDGCTITSTRSDTLASNGAPNVVMNVEFLNGTKLGFKKNILTNTAANCSISLAYSQSVQQTDQKAAYWIYSYTEGTDANGKKVDNPNTTTDIKVVFDNWRFHTTSTADNSYQDMTKVFSSGLYFSGKSFTVELRDSTTKKADGTDTALNMKGYVGDVTIGSAKYGLPLDLFNLLGSRTPNPATTYTVTINNSYMNLTQSDTDGKAAVTTAKGYAVDYAPNNRGVFGVSGTAASYKIGTTKSIWYTVTTYNINIVNGSYLKTTDSKIFDYRMGASDTLTTNIVIDNSQLVATSATVITNSIVSSDNNYATSYALKGATLTIKGDKADVNVKQLVNAEVGLNTKATTFKVDIYGGTVKTSTISFLITNIGNGDVAEMNVYGGKITSTNSIFDIKTADSGAETKFTVYGGTLEAAGNLYCNRNPKSGSVNSFTVYDGTLKGTKEPTMSGTTKNNGVYLVYVPTAAAGSLNTITVYGGTMDSTNSVIYVEKSSASSTTDTSLFGKTTIVSIYGGTFGNLRSYTTESGATLLGVRGLGAAMYIYGGTFMRRGDGSSNMLMEIRTNATIYGGTFILENGGQQALLARHCYATTIKKNDDGTYTAVVSNAGEDLTKLTVYGGTFITQKGCVIGAGTSTGNGYYGNVDVYGGVFVKTVISDTTSGFGIVGHANNRTEPTNASNRISNNVYNIYGGVWVTTTTNDVHGYKVAYSSTGISTQRGHFNRQADNITANTVKLNASNYKNSGITDAAWAVIGDTETGSLKSGFQAEVVTAKTGYTQNFSAADYGRELFGDKIHLQIKLGTLSTDETTDARIVFEINKNVAANVEFAEIGYYVALESGTAEQVIAKGEQVADASGMIWSSLYNGEGVENWSPDDENYGIALLNVENLTNAYFTGGKFYVVAYAKTTSGHVFYSDSYEVDFAAKCGDYIIDAAAAG